ncbi:MAG TPA: GNAT family N-acetyltransferase [Spirochaetia bacterium]|nr:GNAT family N-acetyltransferase [Spirochaetia bacterium]
MRLVRFDAITARAYHDYVSGWEASAEAMIPVSSRPLNLAFEDRLAQWRLAETDEAFTVGFVPNTVFFLADETGLLLGALSYRPRLNDRLRLNGGHLGFGIRPGHRRRGLGHWLLAHAVATLPCLDAPGFLVTCDEDNLASQRTIESCGGVLEDRFPFEAGWTRRYRLATSGPGPRRQ